MMGRQSAVAAIGGATTDAIFWGKLPCIFPIKAGATSNKPAVARTERANPGSLACQGSIAITAAIARARAGRESLLRREPIATRATAAIAAARRTDGVGRTSAIKIARKIAVAISRGGMVRKINCIHQRMKAETIAKLAPLTATK